MAVPSSRSLLVHNLIGSLALVAALAAIAFGLPALDRALPAAQPLPDGEPYEVGGGVLIRPPPGALLDVTKSRPRPDRGSAVFLLDGVRYVVVVEPFDGSLTEAADRLRGKIQATRDYQVTGARRETSTTQGLAGLRGGYTGPDRSGRYAVFLTGDGKVIEVTASGTDPQLTAALDSIEASTASIAYRGSS